ncbi:hypothetical protein LTR15_010379 [Elasticomyces elasticus]|nr:hypothetical protein LTR15_010379 [Elasticomyces elasticus]
MASDLSFRKGKPSVSVIEKALGIKWPRGLGREAGRLKFAVIKELDIALKRVIEQYVVLPCDEILASNNLKAAAYSIFESIGPQMWPSNRSDPSNTRFGWLADASHDNLDGHYPRNLCFALDRDRVQLRESFYHLVIAKCIGYAKNHPTAGANRMLPTIAKTASRQSPINEVERRDLANSITFQKSAGCNTESTVVGSVALACEVNHNANEKVFTAATSSDIGVSAEPSNSHTSGTLTKRSFAGADGGDAKRPCTSQVKLPIREELTVLLTFSKHSTITSETLRASHGGAITDVRNQSANSKRPTKPITIGEYTARHMAKQSADQQSSETHQACDSPAVTASNVPNSASAHGVHFALVHEILGSLADIPMIHSLVVNSKVNHSRRQLAALTQTLNDHPDTRTNPSRLYEELMKIQTGEVVFLESTPPSYENVSYINAEAGQSNVRVVFETAKDSLPYKAGPSPSHAGTGPTVAIPPNALAQKPAELTIMARSESVGGPVISEVGCALDNQVDKPELDTEQCTSSHDLGTTTAPTANLPAMEQINLQNETDHVKPPTVADNSDDSKKSGGLATSPAPAPVASASDQPLCRGQGEVRNQNGKAEPDNVQAAECDKHMHHVASPTASPPALATPSIHALTTALEPQNFQLNHTAEQYPTQKHFSTHRDRQLLERTEVEIDWASQGEIPGYIQLEACDSPADFFAQMDVQNPSKRSFSTVKIEHVDYHGESKSLKTRMHRTGAGGLGPFRAMMRRLTHQDANADADLKVSVEWHTL